MGDVGIEGLAVWTVGVLSSYFKRVAERVSDQSGDALARRLIELIEARFEGDEFGRSALARLRERPDDPRRAQATESALLDALQADPALVAALGQEQAHAGGNSPDQSVGTQSNVAIVGKNSGVFSNGPMNYIKTHQTRVVVGAVVVPLAVAVGAFLLVRSDGDSTEFEADPERTVTTPPANEGQLTDGGNAGPTTTTEPDRLDELPLGEAVEFEDEQGYRFRMSGVIRGKSPTASPDISAPPGTTFPYAVVKITNVQQDRSAPLDDFYNWYLGVPTDVVPRDGDGTPRFRCVDTVPGSCTEAVACVRLNEYGKPTIYKDGWNAGAAMEIGESSDMPAGASWWLTCVPTGIVRTLDSIRTSDAVSDTIAVTDIRFLRIVQTAPYDEELASEIAFP